MLVKGVPVGQQSHMGYGVGGIERQHNLVTVSQNPFTVSEKNHKDADCLVLVILSHGGESVIHGTDGPLLLAEVCGRFNGNLCPSLRGKPKIIFIQVSLWPPLIVRFMGPTWGPSGADRTQVGPMFAPWTLLSGTFRCQLMPLWFLLIFLVFDRARKNFQL